MAVIDPTGVQSASEPATGVPAAGRRLCVFGATNGDWLDAVRSAATVPVESLHADANAAALREAAARFPGADLVLLQAGAALPPHWFERLTRALELDDVLVAAPLDNVDPQRAPLPAGA